LWNWRCHLWVAVLNEGLVLLRAHAVPFIGEVRIERDPVPACEILRLCACAVRVLDLFGMKRIVQLFKELIVRSCGDLAHVSLMLCSFGS
jgi:hypothetical protein